MMMKASAPSDIVKLGKVLGRIAVPMLSGHRTPTDI
jgi:hypothetical protein